MRTSPLLSSVHGTIERVLFTIPYWVLRYGHQAEIRPYREAFAALLTTLPARAERIVVTHAETGAAARSWLQGLGVAERSLVLTVSDDTEFTVWAQDACVVGSLADGSPEWITPAQFPRHDDAQVLRDVAGRLGVAHRVSDLAFQGGNVLVGDDFWLLGADAVAGTVAQGLATDLSAAEANFVRTLGQGRVLHVLGSATPLPHSTTRAWVPGTSASERPWEEAVHTGVPEGSRQPLFDLDTFVSLAGRDARGAYRVLVGDPSLAAELSGRPLPDHALAEAFDEVAESLRAAGFEVIRNPLPLCSHDDPVLRRRWWYFASANNVVTEIDGSGGRVCMPTYMDEEHPELAPTDAMNARIWSSLGFDVVPLPSFHVFAQGLGAAHCVCKCLARSATC